MARIILDRSIFHGDRFTRLETSLLRKLHTRGIVEVIFTTCFIEETLRFSQINKVLFARQWEYLRHLNVKQWFRAPQDIIPLELSGKQSNLKSQYFSAGEIEKVCKSIDDLACGNIKRAELIDAIYKTNRNFGHLDRFRSTVLLTRPDWRRRKPSFEEFFESNVEYWITEGIMFHHNNSEGFLNFWRSNRRDCPLTEYFLKGWLAAVYIPLADHSFPVHRNDKIDAEQLSFMNWADVFVSDDQKFLKRAFELIFPPPNKLLLNSDQFYRFLQLIAPNDI